jgi:hypothetical protein
MAEIVFDSASTLDVQQRSCSECKARKLKVLIGAGLSTFDGIQVMISTV